MKLIRCYIENFGTFHQAHFEFESGLNIFKENNGWGKSTLAAFLKVMLYGMPYSTKRKGLYDRSRYLPWQGGHYGGYLVFEIGNKQYKVVRYFGKKDSEDTYELYDEATHKRSEDFNEKLGEMLFDIDREAFERSMMIRTADQSLTMLDSLHAKLNHLIDNTDDINNYEKAYRELDKKATEILPKKGSHGLIGNLDKRAQELKKAIDDCLLDENQMNRILEQQARHEQEKNELTRQLRLHQESIKQASLAIKRDIYLGYQEKYEAINEEIQAIASEFLYDIPEIEEIEALSLLANQWQPLVTQLEAYGDLESQTKQFQELDHLFQQGVQTFESEALTPDTFEHWMLDHNTSMQLNSEVQNLETQRTYLEQLRNIQSTPIIQPHQKSWHWPIMMMSCLVLIVGFVSVFLFEYGWGIGLVVLGLIGMFIGYSRVKVKGQVDKVSQENKEELSVQEQLLQLEETIKTLKADKEIHEQQYLGPLKKLKPYLDLSRIPQEISELREKWQQYQRLKERLEQASYINNRLQEIQDKIHQLTTRVGYPIAKDESYTQLLSHMRDKLRDLKKKKIESVELMKVIKDFESEHEVERFESIGEQREPIEAIEAKMLAIQELIDMKVRLLGELQNHYLDLSLKVDKRIEYEEELEGNQEQMNLLHQQYRKITLTMDFLQKAKDQLSSHYMLKMTAAFEKYMTHLDNKKQKFILDAELGTKIEEQGKLWSSEYYSQGYYDLVNIAIKLALAEAMYDNEIPFLIFDDPFANFDDDKLAQGLELLRVLSDERQILYFTCQANRI